MARFIDASFDVNADVEGHHATWLTAGYPPEEEGEFAGALYFDTLDPDRNAVDFVLIPGPPGPQIPNGYHLELGGVATHGDGDFSDGAVALTPDMSVSEAVDRINEKLKEVDDEAPDLSDVEITGGTISNVTLINVTVDGGEF